MTKEYLSSSQTGNGICGCQCVVILPIACLVVGRKIRLVGFGSAVGRINNSLLGAMRHKAAWTSADQEPVLGFDALRGCKHALLTTYRNNGDAVPTPIWFGLADDGAVYFYTDEASGKVKRMHNNAQVRLAPCDTEASPAARPQSGLLAFCRRTRPTEPSA